ncbi:MAG: hypothetical protein ACRBFS_04780 [Aureispira sp.]
MTLRMILCSLLLISFSFSSMAQRGASKRERVKALKVAFITEDVQLTSEQAKAFWPLYNELESELKGLRDQIEKRPDFSNASDQEIETWLLQKLSLEEQQIALKRTYIKRFEKVITWPQIAKLLHVERRFKKELLKQIQERRSERRGQ